MSNTTTQLPNGHDQAPTADHQPPVTNHQPRSRSDINRANAQHSTGPRTDAGKKRSSLNALRHGLTGHVIVMPGEDLAAYESFSKTLFDEHQPKTPTEQILVQTIVDISWKLNRAVALENNLLMRGMTEHENEIDSNNPEVQTALAQAAAYRAESRMFANLSTQAHRLMREREKTIKLLLELQTARRETEKENLFHLGRDSMLPFAEACAKHMKGMFLVLKTSNPGSRDYQDLKLESTGQPLYETIAATVNDLGKEMIGECGYSSIGAVVGATFPEDARRLRALMPQAFILVTGYGAQGAGGRNAAVCFNRDGLGAIVNSTRAISYAHANGNLTRQSFVQCVRENTLRMIDDITTALKLH